MIKFHAVQFDPVVQKTLSDVLYKKPGHLIRRLQTLGVTLFLEEADGLDTTFDQFCVLAAVMASPDADQLRIAQSTGFDRSTVSGILTRLESKALITRETDTEDRRAKIIRATRSGHETYRKLGEAADRADTRMLEALTARDQKRFSRMLAALVRDTNDVSRVPMAGPEVNASLGRSLYSRPIYQMRRLQQFAVTVFLEETAGYDITPVQFGALVSVLARPGIDQIRLSQTVGFDRNTLSGVLERLETKGLITREPSATDRRAKVLFLTVAGHQLYETLFDATERSNVRMLHGLDEIERNAFLAMMERIVWAHNETSRAPVDESHAGGATGQLRANA
ncbi:MarR family winged helix-turn-helix transcriptional regulator [Paraburkholderia saeva]|uniref:MarR family winged helix-turn-helix transcriptional regulator n=1 Tax=Paraburkholderia saeva TaxID=2777537 RepID=UPI001D651E62|nr:MarR family transcriptional regulator [Paraburkholderia saeva]CAG4886524.1 Transcriptional regulator SlyA [Paraburkholderia saeva]